MAFLSGCAEKEMRVWIEPPQGYETQQGPKNLLYRVEDVQSGKRETLSIPIAQAPQNIVVEDHEKKGADTGATKADHQLRGGALLKPAAEAPTLSYLKGVEEVEALYRRKKYGTALIKLAPLIEQYPNQVRLFLMQGTLYKKTGEKKMAVLSLERARELSPDDPALEEALFKAQSEIGVIQ